MTQNRVKTDIAPMPHQVTAATEATVLAAVRSAAQDAVAAGELTPERLAWRLGIGTTVCTEALLSPVPGTSSYARKLSVPVVFAAAAVLGVQIQITHLGPTLAERKLKVRQRQWPSMPDHEILAHLRNCRSLSALALYFGLPTATIIERLSRVTKCWSPQQPRPVQPRPRPRVISDARIKAAFHKHGEVTPGVLVRLRMTAAGFTRRLWLLGLSAPDTDKGRRQHASDRVLMDAASGRLRISEVAMSLDISEDTVRHRLIQLGLPVRKRLAVRSTQDCAEADEDLPGVVN